MRLILCDDSQLGLLRSVLPDAHEAPETHGTCVLPFSRWAAVSLSAGAADAEASVVWPCGLKVDGFEVSSVLWLAGLSDQGADPQQQLLRQKWLAAVSLVFPESAGVPRACDPLYAGDEAFRMQVLAQRLGWDAVNVLHAATRHAGGMTVGWPPMASTTSMRFVRPSGEACLGLLAQGRICCVSERQGLIDVGESALPENDLFEFIAHAPPAVDGGVGVSNWCMVWASPGLQLLMSLRRSRAAIQQLLPALLR